VRAGQHFNGFNLALNLHVSTVVSPAEIDLRSWPLGVVALCLRGTMRAAGRETATESRASHIEMLDGFKLAGRVVYRTSLADGYLRYTRVTFWLDYASASLPTILVFCNQRCTFGA
jgi:hypothetical protein